MTYWLASIPGTTVAGINSFGVMQFTQPSYMILPNSRVAFRIARGTSDLYGDRRSLDGYGLDVDLILGNKEDSSPASILALAEVLVK